MNVTVTIKALRLGQGKASAEVFQHKFFTVDAALEFLPEAIKGWIVKSIEITVA